MWESVLPEALSSIRGLLCTATNATPHSWLLNFSRKGTQGFSPPLWWTAGKQAYMKVFVRRKDEPLVQPVRITQVINPFFARVEQTNDRIDTVSIRALSSSHSPKDRDSNVGVGATDLSSCSPSPGEVVVPDSLDHTSVIEMSTETSKEEANEEDKNNQASSRPVCQCKSPTFIEVYGDNCGVWFFLISMGECML